MSRPRSKPATLAADTERIAVALAGVVRDLARLGVDLEDHGDKWKPSPAKRAS